MGFEVGDGGRRCRAGEGGGMKATFRTPPYRANVGGIPDYGRGAFCGVSLKNLRIALPPEQGYDRSSSARATIVDDRIAIAEPN